MQRSSSDTLDARDPRLRCGDQHTATITSRSERLLELKTATVLERLGLCLDSGDGPFVRALLPFVIDPESVQTIPPLASIPAAFVVHQPGQSGGAQRGQDFADAQAISCQHLALQPVPVLAPALAHLLIGSGDGLEVEFIDGNNVYGANVFERHEGRRLLRRAIGFVYDQLESDGRDVDIIVHEADGFLVVRPYRAGAEPLRDRLQQIIAAMNGAATDPASAAASSRIWQPSTDTRVRHSGTGWRVVRNRETVCPGGSQERISMRRAQSVSDSRGCRRRLTI